jgi:hypothetical protein
MNAFSDPNLPKVYWINIVMSTHNWFLEPSSPLLAFEFQYFRAPRQEWERNLLRIRQMGANTISTCVMWGWHEASEGQFDFTGQTAPERDLVGFINLVQELGFWLLLKPGPFIDAEILGGGIPSWLLEKIPEAQARRHDGLIWRLSRSKQPRLSYLHPLSLDYARRWLAAFSQAAVAAQWPDGPVIALQIDHETPGDGFIAGDQGEITYDYHFRGDYNPYYTQALWPQWLEERHGSLDNLAAAYGRLVNGYADLAFPDAWSEPQSIEDLRLWMDVARFVDWTFSQALRQYAAVLCESGWEIPFFQNLLSTPWETGGLAVNMGGLATAAGWLGQDVRPAAVRTPLVDDDGVQMGFEEYVQFAFWRAKLVKNYNPVFPSFVPQISSVGDFILQAMFVGGTDAAGIYPGVQSDPEPAAVGVSTQWAMEAPIRRDGSLRRRMWNTKTLFHYLQTGGRDFALSHAPADLILGYTHTPELVSQWYFWPGYYKPIESRNSLPKPAAVINKALRGADTAARSQSLAQEMVYRQMDFDVLDIDFASSEQLDPSRLLVLPASNILARRTQQRLADFLRRGGRIAWVGGELPGLDETLTSCVELQKAAEETGRALKLPDLPANWPEKLVQMGYFPRYAWSDASEGVDVTVRYGPDHVVFLSVANRANQTYEGKVYFLDIDRQIQTVKVRVAGPHISFMTLSGGRLQNAILHGQDGAYIQVSNERYEIDRGQVALIRSGAALLVSSADSASVAASRSGGWGKPAIWRVILNGRVLPYSSVKIAGKELAIDYSAEAGISKTMLILINPAQQLLDEPNLRLLFDTHLAYCSRMLNKVIAQTNRLVDQLSGIQGQTEQHPNVRQLATILAEVIQPFETLVSGSSPYPGQPYLVEAYAKRMQRLVEALESPETRLVEALSGLRSALAAGNLPAEAAWVERELTLILETLNRIR